MKATETGWSMAAVWMRWNGIWKGKQKCKVLMKVETRGDRTGPFWEGNWLEWTVIFPPEDNMSVSAEVMCHPLSAEALFWWFSLLVNRWNSSCPKNLPASFKKMYRKCWNKRKVNYRLKVLGKISLSGRGWPCSGVHCMSFLGSCCSKVTFNWRLTTPWVNLTGYRPGTATDPRFPIQRTNTILLLYLPVFFQQPFWPLGWEPFSWSVFLQAHWPNALTQCLL